ncbi:hypothetical protein LAZ67_1005917 [Cordylochernes scorpioides]|uniref:Uncharacterized protein n=1 Tax=Cordylochernes scorpioides TaxID=51811 RepID=A0ABY6JZ96_9ARAC|nr:hypothetical protein LAZ67_1005917 [Cordylochernes scorpioides]
MDFCIFGCLKRALGKRHPRAIEGLWKVVKEEWDLLSMTMIRKCMLSWKISPGRDAVSLHLLDDGPQHAPGQDVAPHHLEPQDGDSPVRGLFAEDHVAHQVVGALGSPCHRMLHKASLL